MGGWVGGWVTFVEEGGEGGGFVGHVATHNQDERGVGEVEGVKDLLEVEITRTDLGEVGGWVRGG